MQPSQFRVFYPKDFLSPKDVNEKLCLQFQKHLLRKLTGETPLNYFAAFSRVVKAAKKEGYFHDNPVEDVKPKSNPSKNLKEFLEAEDYIQLMKTPHSNKEITEAFVISCYTGLRWCDVSTLKWDDFNGSQLTTRIIQKKKQLQMRNGLRWTNCPL